MSHYSEKRVKKALENLKSDAPPEFVKSVMNIIIASDKKGFPKSWWIAISLGATCVITLAIVFGFMGNNSPPFNMVSKNFEMNEQPGGNSSPMEKTSSPENEGFVIVKVIAPNPFEYAKIIEAKLASQGELYLTDQQGFPVLNLVVPASKAKQAIDVIRSVGGEGVYHQVKEERKVPKGPVRITIQITTK